MERLLAVTAWASLIRTFDAQQPAVCFLPDTVEGQNQLLANPGGISALYQECKSKAALDNAALCVCAKNQMAQANGCTYPWIVPWIQTVQTDRNKYCGTSSSMSLDSSSSGSGASSSASLPSSQQSGSMQSGPLTTPQRIFFIVLGVCCCLCICGVVGALVAMNQKKKSKNKSYDDLADQEYDDRGYEPQYDQQYAQPPYDQQYDQGQYSTEMGQYSTELPQGYAAPASGADAELADARQFYADPYEASYSTKPPAY